MKTIEDKYCESGWDWAEFFCNWKKFKKTCVCFVFMCISEPQDGVQPWFITKPKSTTVCEGQHALLSCAIAGDPFPEFLWIKEGQAVSSCQDFEVLQKEDVVSLLIRRVKAHHAGNYEIHLKYELFYNFLLVVLMTNFIQARSGFTGL